MLPDRFIKRMKELLGNEYDTFIKEYEKSESIRSFRINSIKITDHALSNILKYTDGQIPFSDDGYYTHLDKPGILPQHHAGMLYMQDPSAMSTVTSLKINSDWKILDSCAAPGGKTTQLAAIAPDGIIVANEYVPSRCRILQGNVERMGCKNVIVTQLDTSVLSDNYRDYFDLVLTDAPCSGEGMFRKNDVAVEEWSEENVKRCAERQLEILGNTCKCVKPGGYLLYSTCTFSVEENENVVSSFLDSHSDFELCDVTDVLRSHTSDGITFDGCIYDMSKTRRFYPHISPGEGQFIALMRRKSCNNSESEKIMKKKSKEISCSKCYRSLSPQEEKTVRDFLNEVLEAVPDTPLIMCGNTVYLCPDVPLTAFGIYSCGVAVGTVSNNRVIPHHQLFSAYGTLFKNKIDYSSDDPIIMRYLYGEELHYDGDKVGWCAVLVDGCALGGGKISNGVIKNHYPKGLRNH